VPEAGQRQLGRLRAAPYLAGPFEDVPSADFRRVIETNLLGYVHGARAAVRQFRPQGGGVLINNASIAGVVPMPYFSAYTAAKFGVVGFGLALRQELRGSGIEVCTVLPSSIDTPIFQHAGNYQGHPIRAMTPTYRPDQVARALISVAERPRRVAIVGGSGCQRPRSSTSSWGRHTTRPWTGCSGSPVTPSTRSRTSPRRSERPSARKRSRRV